MKTKSSTPARATRALARAATPAPAHASAPSPAAAHALPSAFAPAAAPTPAPFVTYLAPEQILYHITVATPPGYLIETNRGYMPYAQWVEEERQRIVKKSGWPVVTYYNTESGEMSLVHLRVKGTS